MMFSVNILAEDIEPPASTIVFADVRLVEPFIRAMFGIPLCYVRIHQESKENPIEIPISKYEFFRIISELLGQKVIVADIDRPPQVRM